MSKRAISMVNYSELGQLVSWAKLGNGESAVQLIRTLGQQVRVFLPRTGLDSEYSGVSSEDYAGGGYIF